jgi:hypothetical protein
MTYSQKNSRVAGTRLMMTQTAYPPSTIEQERLQERVAELGQGDKTREILGGDNTHKIPRENQTVEAAGVITCMHDLCTSTLAVAQAD